MTGEALQRRVLVIDDDDSVRKVTMRALEAFGFSCVGAASGDEGAELFGIRHETLDCVIVDMSMPGMDGEQTLAALRAIDTSVPVVLASGHSVADMREQFDGRGFAGYLQKPFQIAVLAETVAEVIAHASGGGVSA